MRVRESGAHFLLTIHEMCIGKKAAPAFLQKRTIKPK
jgi:hypothetical protein